MRAALSSIKSTDRQNFAAKNIQTPSPSKRGKAIPAVPLENFAAMSVVSVCAGCGGSTQGHAPFCFPVLLMRQERRQCPSSAAETRIRSHTLARQSLSFAYTDFLLNRAILSRKRAAKSLKSSVSLPARRLYCHREGTSQSDSSSTFSGCSNFRDVRSIQHSDHYRL